jgi:hypothetical protein
MIAPPSRIKNTSTAHSGSQALVAVADRNQPVSPKID